MQNTKIIFKETSQILIEQHELKFQRNTEEFAIYKKIYIFFQNLKLNFEILISILILSNIKILRINSLKKCSVKKFQICENLDRGCPLLINDISTQ
jgi:hypothetical protein